MLYEKYRPSKFQEVVGQNMTPEILRRQVEKETVGHSYILTGNRGSGKTTTGRIFAKAINCSNNINGEPCGECESCKSFEKGIHPDIVEIDAASNNGVDNIRSLISDTQYGPQMGKYKVYIIDEAHMLTPGASNAFLKTLEEPPKYVVLILATTDPQKLPITVLSRCQRFDFRRISKDIIQERITQVSLKENIKIEPKAADLIAKLADGAMRDGLSLLEQCFSLGNNITYKDASNLLGISRNEEVFALLKSIVSKNTLNALEAFGEVNNTGKDINIFFQEFLKMNRNLLIVKTNLKDCNNLLVASDDEIEELIQLSKSISAEGILRNIRVLQDLERDIKFSSNSNILFEMAIIKMCRTMENDIEGLYEILNDINKKLKTGVISSVNDNLSEDLTPCDDEPPFENTSNNEVKVDDESEQDKKYEEDEEDEDLLEESIDKVINKLKDVGRKDIASILDDCQYTLEDSCLTILTCDIDSKEELDIVKRVLTQGFSKYLNEEVNIKIKISK